MLVVTALAAVPVHAVQPAPEPTPQPTSEPASVPPLAGPADDIVIDELAITEADLRMTVPVSVSGGVPLPFVIDTGAERSVVSSELAGRLGLRPGRPRRVTTMAGTAPAATAVVPELRVGPLSIGPVEAPIFKRANLGAIGILGIDALQGHKVSIDFVRNTMALLPSRKQQRRIAAARDEIVVQAKSLYGQLIVTNARWRGRNIAVVIDTGSPVTIGNSALLRLGRKLPPAIGPMVLVAASGETITAAAYRLDRLEIGGVSFMGVPVGIVDMVPFERFGLANRPALLLGMDALRLFRAADIDFANRTIILKLPREAMVSATPYGP